jgi:hypothetical protein
MEKMKMNSNIEKTLNEVSKLDSWDVGSVLGAVNYLVRQTALNQTVRMLPDLPPPESGMEYFTDWESKMRNPEIKEKVAPLLGVADRVGDVMNEYSTMNISSCEDVLKFMLSPDRVPKRETFQREYDDRKKKGMKPGMSINEFVEAEYAVALIRHNNLVAKGEAAVKVIDSIDPSDGDVPEWLHEAIHAKVLQKLAQRWNRAELRRTNPRITKQDRDLAAANQRLIESVILELGGEIPRDMDVPEEGDDLDAFIAKVEGMDAAKRQ